MSDKTKILVLPGMGDIYWVLVKFQSFIEKNGITDPVLYTWELQSHKKDRSADYIKRYPHAEYGGGWTHSQDNQVFKNIYFGNTWKVEQFEQFDYVLSMNGVLRNGNSIETFNDLANYDNQWFFPMWDSDEETSYINQCKMLGDYIVAYFSDDGMFKTWVKHLPPAQIYELLKRIYDKTGYNIILSGCSWDEEFVKKITAYDKADILIKKFDTTINQLFGMIRQSKGMIGWCGGNTIKSVYFKKPTVIIWSEYFKDQRFYANSVPPESLDNWHKYFVVEQTGPVEIADAMVDLLHKDQGDFYKGRLQLYYDGGMPELSHYSSEFFDKVTGNKAIDVGANIGEITYFLTDYVDEVHSFEPNPIVYDTLTHMINPNIYTYNVALSDVNGTSTLLIPKDAYLDNTPNDGLSSLNSEWLQQLTIDYPSRFNTKNVNRVNVQIKTLDSYNFTGVKIIKVDVEGHEFNVIKGAEQTIMINRPLVIIEIVNNPTVFKLMRSFNYICYYYNGNNQFHVLHPNEKIETKELKIYNFVFVPKELT